MTTRARPALLSSSMSPGRGRRSRLSHRRAVGVTVVAVVAFAAGTYAGARSEDPRALIAERFAKAWARADYRGMHALLSGPAQRRASARRLERTYRQAAETATAQQVVTGRPVEGADGQYAIGVRVRTRVFGTLPGRISLPISGDGEAEGIDWVARMAFPGLRPGERLSRSTELAPRAAILTRGGTAIAEGAQRASSLGPPAAEIAGRLGPVPPELADDYARRGIPPETQVGLNGLEREFDLRLLGTPGGALRAGDRTLARTPPERGASVRTSIDASIQRSVVEALAGRFGGIAVLKPSTGEVLGLAGVAFSAPQPPGSTFKIVTTAAALRSGVVKRTATFPRETKTTIEGVDLENANGEVCGGSLARSFAESCNSVFAPLGARLGARRLVAAAERFGFNEEPPLRGAARSTIPPAREIGDDLAVGSSAIGQGRVLATPLLMASVAATIAEGGKRHRPSLERGGADVAPVTATTAAVARTLERFMRGVVREGTGTAAAIPGVSVAGKTGTAELRDTTEVPAAGPDTLPGEAPLDDAADTDAWFTAYAPTSRPRLAVAVMLIGQGAGGDTAAPAARQVLVAGLKATR